MEVNTSYIYVLYATTNSMFIFADIKRQYTFESEKLVFDRLNQLTYNNFWQVMEGDFVADEPPTFELWYTGDIQYSGKPISTKLTITLHQIPDGVKVKATASANKMFYILSGFVLLALVIQLFRGFALSATLTCILLLFVFILWDRWAKVSALKRLERILS